MTDVLMVISAILTTVATGVMAWFAWTSTRLAKAIKEDAENQEREMKQLQITLATATLYGAVHPGGKPLNIEEFKRLRKDVDKMGLP